jgi:uncharacterized protein YdhG (YjbR/CyaY superfamily)
LVLTQRIYAFFEQFANQGLWNRGFAPGADLKLFSISLLFQCRTAARWAEHRLELALLVACPHEQSEIWQAQFCREGTGAPKDFDEYLAGVPEPARGTLNRIRAVIRSAMPADAEAISYGIPAFKYKGSLMWYAAFSNHCSLFPTASVIEAFKNELKGFSTSKGTIHFLTDKPLPTVLVKKLVRARVAQNESKKRN